MSATAEQRVFVRWTRTCDRCGFESGGEAETGRHAAIETRDAGWLRIAYEYLPDDPEAPLPLQRRPDGPHVLDDPEDHERLHRWMWSERDLCPECTALFATFVLRAPA